MELRRAIAEFDGTRTAPLQQAVATFDGRDAELLVKMCQGKDAVAATWIVKALLEADRAAPLDLGQVFDALPDVDRWETALHLLQIVQYAPDAALHQIGAIRRLMGHSKALVRVWALDAFVRLALVEDMYLPEARVLVEKALIGEAPSTRARARALNKLLGKPASGL